MSRIRSINSPPDTDVRVLIWFRGEWEIGYRLVSVWVLDGRDRVLPYDEVKWWAQLPPAPKDCS